MKSNPLKPLLSLRRPVRISMISLGCPKALVDSEIILGNLGAGNYVIVEAPERSDVAIVNTCSFIHDARQESIDQILTLLGLKKKGKLKAVVVVGCLVQEFPEEIKKELYEVDAFLGSGEYDKILQVMESVLQGERVFQIGTPGYLQTASDIRFPLTPRYFRYLKISEGCDHACSFCTIPKFRGRHRSRPMDEIVGEARRLIQEGAREIILTGQDTSYYGMDLSGKFLLGRLLRELNALSGLRWIRVLYAYPSCLTPSLMEAMHECKHVCRYLDIPLQHASDRMLKAMNRGITQQRTINLINTFRKKVPGLALRTTFIVGFPGETEKDFQELLDFMQGMHFERAGVFKYSREPSTRAGAMLNQVPEAIKEERFQRAMELQQKISSQNLQSFQGRTIPVLVEQAPHSKNRFWTGRSEFDAPEIDGNVLIDSRQSLTIGSFRSVKIIETKEYDLVGVLKTA